MAVNALTDHASKGRTGLTAGEDTINASGGASFGINDLNRLKRFLILGSEGGTFYKRGDTLTAENVGALARTVAVDPTLVIATILDAGLKAPKRSYALFALAFVQKADSDPAVQKAVADALVALVRTGTDLFEFVTYAKSMRGWGRSLKKVVQHVIDSTPDSKLELWAVKYRSRDGWTWRDLMRVLHPNVNTVAVEHALPGGSSAPKPGVTLERALIYRYMAGHMPHENAARTTDLGLLKLVAAYESLKGADEATVLKTLTDTRLPWEALSDEQRTANVWKALVPTLGDTALIRNLTQLTRNGVLKPADKFTFEVAARIRTVKYHPVKAFEAYRTYQSGGSTGRAGKEFTPVAAITDALEACVAFNFATVEKSDLLMSISLDVSGSMTWENSADGTVLTGAEIGTALALAAKQANPNCTVNRFDHRFDADVNVGTTFDSAYQALYGGRFGGTDVALPIKDALAKNQFFDAFVIISDNETHGVRTPAAVLKEYRAKVNPSAKFIVLSTTATSNSVADPADPLSLDIPGFTSDVIDAIGAFARS
jgi:60 kDa SS-A/Ro ribonucleoprotein